MKSTLVSLFIVFVSISLAAQAQDEGQSVSRRVPRWISEKGYWVVESNIKTPYHSVIHFYNNENIEVYKEKVDGVKINLDRSRTKMKLKKVLEQSIVAWENNHMLQDNSQLVVRALR